MPLDPSSSDVPSCSCPLIRFPLVLPCAGFEEVSWSWSRAGEQRVGLEKFLGLGPGQVNNVLDWKSFLGLGPGQVNNVLDWKSFLVLVPGR